MPLGLAGRSDSRDWPHWVIGVALAGLSFALYLIFRQRFLYHEDSVGFAQSIHHFDVLAHQPQAPGYLLYVLSLRVTERLTGLSDGDTMTTVSILATLGAVLIFFLLASSWLSRVEAVAVTLFFATSPVVWFNADIALSYAVGLAGSVAVAFVAYRTHRTSGYWFYALPLVWALVCGFRPELTVVLAPLVLFGSWPRIRRSFRDLVIMLALGAIGIAAWLVPLVKLAGGMRQFEQLMSNRSYGASIVPAFSSGQLHLGVRLLAENALVGVVFLALGLLGVIPLQFAWLEKRPTAPGKPLAFLLCWFVPGAVLDLISVVGHSGYVLPYLPAALMLLWPAGQRLRLTISRNSVLVGLGIILQGAYFLTTPQIGGVLAWHWIPDTLERAVLDEPTRSRLVQDDQTTSALVSTIRARFPASQTLLLVPVGDEVPRDAPLRAMFAQGQYYLPEWNQRIIYTTQPIDFAFLHMPEYVTAAISGPTWKFAYTNIITIPDQVRWIVWFCDPTYQAYPWDSSWQRVAITPDVTMIVADVSGSAPSQRTWGPWVLRKTESPKSQ